MSEGGVKAQGQVTAYHKWVIEKLVDVEGRSESDVVARIIGFWIYDRDEWLKERGISFPKYLEGMTANEKEGKLLDFQANGTDTRQS